MSLEPKPLSIDPRLTRQANSLLNSMTACKLPAMNTNQDQEIIRRYMARIGSEGGKAGKGDSKRKGAEASWSKEAREKRRLNMEQKRKTLCSSNS